LPIQDLTAGERYVLGVRPSRSVARRTESSKIDLYAEGLSNGASFRMVGDEIWELVWFPAPSDSGVHNVRILVTERGRPTDVLEVQELTFVVDGVPVSPSTPTTDPTSDATLSASHSGSADESEREPQPVAAMVSVDLDSPENDTILVIPANTGNADLAVDSDTQAWSDFMDKLDESSPQADKPNWSLASIASRVVTPHQWVRFPVELISESAEVNNTVAVQVDTLPNGATFDANDDGTRQFQWRPGTADGGEHVFNFTAVDTENANNRHTVTMRIIVQE